MHAMIIRAILATTIVALVAGPGEAAAGRPAPANVGGVRVEVDAGRLSAQAHRVPLGDVLRAVERGAGIRFRLVDPELAGRALSFDIRARAPEEAVRLILKGFSYVLEVDGAEHVVTILAASRPAPATPAPRAETRPSAETARSTHATSVARAHAAQTERSLAALDLGPLDERHEHLETLVGANDSRATGALVRESVLPASPRPGERLAAVRRLWRHAASLRFADEASLSALRGLADDGDAAVADMARDAIEDLERYRRAVEPSQAP